MTPNPDVKTKKQTPAAVSTPQPTELDRRTRLLRRALDKLETYTAADGGRGLRTLIDEIRCELGEE
jgi:hypothetical protein